MSDAMDPHVLWLTVTNVILAVGCAGLVAVVAAAVLRDALDRRRPATPVESRWLVLRNEARDESSTGPTAAG